jgi:twitching motility two-component system response regulator PilG
LAWDVLKLSVIAGGRRGRGRSILALSAARVGGVGDRNFPSKHGGLADLLDRFANYWLNSTNRARGAQGRRPLLEHRRDFFDRGLDVEQSEKDGNLAGLKVMVIDDSKTIRRTAETLLKKEGCDVVTATDGFEALAKISDQQPNIIFVDIMMPRLDGYQTCALIKNNQMFKGTPVIMLSSKDGLFDKARGRIVGSEQYLTKPFTREELLGAIRRHVAR